MCIYITRIYCRLNVPHPNGEHFHHVVRGQLVTWINIRDPGYTKNHTYNDEWWYATRIKSQGVIFFNDKTYINLPIFLFLFQHLGFGWKWAWLYPRWPVKNFKKWVWKILVRNEIYWYKFWIDQRICDVAGGKMEVKFWKYNLDAFCIF